MPIPFHASLEICSWNYRRMGGLRAASKIYTLHLAAQGCLYSELPQTSQLEGGILRNTCISILRMGWFERQG